MKSIRRLFKAMSIIPLIFLTNEAMAASGCSFPGSLDSFANKVSSDFLTVADVNKTNCGLEQAQLRIQQILTGKAGSQQITGGTAAAEFIVISSTAHASKGNIFFGASGISVFNEANGRLGLGIANPTRVLEIVSSSAQAVSLTTVGGSVGPRLDFYHADATVADIGGINFLVDDASNTPRHAVQIIPIYLDGTTASQDSQIQFCVMNNVNAADCNTTATLSSLGVWTDASTEKIKEYEGDIAPVLGRLKELKTLGVYRGKNVPENKLANAERHYSPTAEEFWQVFKLGKEDSGGIAPKDVSWLAVKAVLELEARVAAIEGK